jgi:hypothetical protein
MAAPMIRCARQVALRKFVVNRNVRQRRRSDGSDCDRDRKCARFPSRFQENSGRRPQFRRTKLEAGKAYLRAFSDSRI